MGFLTNFHVWFHYSVSNTTLQFWSQLLNLLGLWQFFIVFPCLSLPQGFKGILAKCSVECSVPQFGFVWCFPHHGSYGFLKKNPRVVLYPYLPHPIKMCMIIRDTEGGVDLHHLAEVLFIRLLHWEVAFLPLFCLTLGKLVPKCSRCEG